MSIKNEEKDKEKFKEYNISIFEYEKKIDSYIQSKKAIEDKGYLVDYEDFNELKQNLDYNSNKFYIKNNLENRISMKFIRTKFDKIKKLEPIKVKSIDYIKNIIINMKCILITEDLSCLISNKEKPLSFKVNNDNLVFKIKIGEELNLKHKNFILDDQSFDKKESSDNEIRILFDSMWNYFKFENDIINKLNGIDPINQKNEYNYLVKKSWLDEWKNYSNYENYKKKYFNENKNNLTPIVKKSIIKEIIDYREQNRYKNKQISETNIIKLNDVDEFRSFLPLGFIDNKFKNLFPFFNNQSDLTRYNLCNKQINIIIKNSTLSFKSNNNILLKENIVETEQNSKQLINNTENNKYKSNSEFKIYDKYKKEKENSNNLFNSNSQKKHTGIYWKNKSDENVDYTNLKNHIRYSIILDNEYYNINQYYNNEENIPEINISDDYYLINDDYLFELETFIHFPYIQKKIQNIYSKGKQYNSEDEMVEDIFNDIKNEKIASEINKKDDKILEELNNKELYQLKQNTKKINGKDYTLFENCQIINKIIYDLLRKIDINLTKYTRCKSVRCIFSKKKAILLIDNSVIKIGALNNNNIFTPDLLIYTEQRYSKPLQDIFNLIKEKGFELIENFISTREINYKRPRTSLCLKAKIHILNEEENKNENKPADNKPYQKKIGINKSKIINSKNISDISDDLKKLIILFLSLQKTERNYWRGKKNSEEVYLLNKKWIDQFDKNDINELSKEINSIYSQNYNLCDLKDAISKIDNSILENLDNKIKNKTSKEDLNSDHKNLKIDKKKIKIYDEFLLISKEMLLKYGKDIKFNFNSTNISYIQLNNNDIIIINEFSQFTILTGNYNDKTYYFDIKYIFKYNDKTNFDREKNYIISTLKDIKPYIDKNIVLSQNSDDISPIFNEKEIIGTCCKYNRSKTNYSPDFNYSEILDNTNLISSIALAYNYQKINNYISDLKSIIEDDFYLIGSDSMKKIQNEYNYEKIFEFIKNSDMNINIFEEEVNYKMNLLKSIKSTEYKQLIDILNKKNNIINIMILN